MGKNSVALGVRARAKKDNSVVVNLVGSENAASTRKGQFLVNAKLLTFRVGDTAVDIDSENIGILDGLLNPGRRVLTKNESVGDGDESTNGIDKSIRDLREEVAKQKEVIASLHDTIESMRATMESFIMNNQNNKDAK